MIYSVISPTAWIHEQPDDDGHLRSGDSQLLFGEQFQSSHIEGDWIYGTSLIDGYKGWVQNKYLSKTLPALSHLIDVRLADLYPSPSFKMRPVHALGFMSRLALTTNFENGFIQTQSGLWVHETHVTPLDAPPTKDLSSTALMLSDTPYLYGGRSSFGIDCSGLIGLALQRHHINTRRDSGHMIDDIGQDIAKTGPFMRNDIIHLKGHIGIMLDDTNFLNATARHMRVVIEPLHDVVRHYEGGVLRVKRPSPNAKLAPVRNQALTI